MLWFDVVLFIYIVDLHSLELAVCLHVVCLGCFIVSFVFWWLGWWFVLVCFWADCFYLLLVCGFDGALDVDVFCCFGFGVCVITWVFCACFVFRFT